MRRIIVTGLVAVCVTACGKAPEGSGAPAVTTTPPIEAQSMKFETVPFVVSAKMVKPQESAILAGATWTAKQCDWTLAGDAEEKKDIVAPATGNTAFEGFFIDPTDQPAGEFLIVLKGGSGDYAVPAKTGWDRSDVANFFKQPQLANSGFSVSADLTDVAAGTYSVDFLVDRGGTKYFCESGKKLIVQH